MRLFWRTGPVLARKARSALARREGCEVRLRAEDHPPSAGGLGPWSGWLRPGRGGLRRGARLCEGGADRSLELADVLACVCGGLLLIAREDRLEEAHVLADVADEVRDPRQREAPDAGGEVVQVDERLLQVSVVDGPVDEPVDAQVALDEGARILFGIESADALDRLGELRAQRRRDVAGGAARGDGLERLAHLRDRREVRDVDGAGEGAAARVRHDEVLALEPLEGLTDGGSADPQLGAQGRLVDGVAGGGVEHDEAVAEDLVGVFGQGCPAGGGLRRCAHLCTHLLVIGTPAGKVLRCARARAYATGTQLIY